MLMKKFTFLLVMAIMTVTVYSQQVVFSENFDDGSASSRWVIAESGGPNTSNFAFDYVGAGIPTAPNGGGLGLKYEVNTADGVESQILAYPDGQTFEGALTLSFDVWLNFEGETATTEFALFGVKKTGTAAPDNTGIDFVFTPDNGAARDVRAYIEGVEQLAENGDGGYGNPLDQSTEAEPYTDSYEGDFPGNQWLSVDVIVTAETVTLKINDILWSEIPTLTTDGNIVIGYWDAFSSVAPATSFAIYDNIQVTQEGSGINRIEFGTVSVYPNPAEEELNIRVNERSTVELFNSLGQMVYRSVVEGTSSIDVSSYNAGVYVAKITSATGQVETHKILVK
jgi:hypothetical protein